MDLVVVVPVGPTTPVALVQDTLDSVTHWCPNARLLVLDDSGSSLADGLAPDPRVIVRRTADGPSGTQGGHYLVVAEGLAAAYAMGADLVLRMDTDALMIGAGLALDAAALLQREPEVGILGSYRVDCNGRARDFSGPAALLQRELRARRPSRRRARLREVHALARDHGYVDGEHALGAAVVFGRAGLGRMQEAGLLVCPELAGSRLCDDHLLGLLGCAAGARIADFATDPLPLGISWIGLPAPPQELVDRGKKLVHSIKSTPTVQEADTRAFFRDRRR